MTRVEIFGKSYMFAKGLKDSYNINQKRAVKLAARFEELSNKFDGMIERGNYVSVTAQCALACKMMMYTGIRIGNEGSAEGYVTNPHPNSKKEPEFVRTYGLTTLLPEHIQVQRGTAYINFIGKKSVENSFTVKGELAKQIKKTLATVLEGETFLDITAYELTKFIKSYVGRRFMPKDFRTMRANMYASEKMQEITQREAPSTKREYNAEVREICEYVAQKLNNTPGVCKKSYIDGDMWAMYEEVRPIIKKK